MADKSESVVGADPQELMADLEPKDVEIEFKGKVWNFKVRELPWRQKKRAVTSATAFTRAGEIAFNWEEYYRHCLKFMVVAGPVKIDDIFLTGMDEEFGALLEGLVPRPWPRVEVEEEKKD